jgi:hypothetical protein
VRSLFSTRVKQHDHKGEQDHDGARVDDDLGGCEEFGSEEQVEDGKRAHNNDERERGIDGVALEEEIQCSSHAQTAKDEEQNQMHFAHSTTRNNEGVQDTEGRL